MLLLLLTLTPTGTSRPAVLLQACSRRDSSSAHCFGWRGASFQGCWPVWAGTRDMELLVLVTMALALGTAALTRAAGLSIALGAFLAGLLVNESEFAHNILAKVLPMRDVFVAVFFASIGLLVQPALLATQVPMIAILVLLVVVGNFLIWLLLLRAAGYGRETAGLAALSLTHIGEFSYVLSGAGLREGLITACLPGDPGDVPRDDHCERVALSAHPEVAPEAYR